MTRGWFITLDGPGGAGKSTLTHQAVKALGEAGLDVLATTEPSAGPIGQLARHHTHLLGGHALACLVAADRYHHLEAEILPALAAGTTVVCDRYLASSLALQVLDGVEPDFVLALHTRIQQPDLSVILTCDPGELRRRLAVRGSHGRFEDDPTLPQRESARYQQIAQQLAADGTRILLLDSTHHDAQTLAEHLTAAIQALPSPPH